MEWKTNSCEVKWDVNTEKGKGSWPRFPDGTTQSNTLTFYTTIPYQTLVRTKWCIKTPKRKCIKKSILFYFQTFTIKEINLWCNIDRYVMIFLGILGSTGYIRFRRQIVYSYLSNKSSPKHSLLVRLRIKNEHISEYLWV